MTDQDFETLLNLGHEQNGVEFKGPGKRTDKDFAGKVIRAMLGMANRRDGGLVVLGVDSETLEAQGLEDQDVATWKYDHLATLVNEYASPSVRFVVDNKVRAGRTFLVITIDEFAEIPVLCCKDRHATSGKDLILRRGACYVRSRHKPETSEIPSEEEMRELLEIATDKGVDKFLARAKRFGLYGGVLPGTLRLEDKDRFDEQVQDMT